MKIYENLFRFTNLMNDLHRDWMGSRYVVGRSGCAKYAAKPMHQRTSYVVTMRRCEVTVLRTYGYEEMKQAKGWRPIDKAALKDLETTRDAVLLDDGRTMLIGQHEGMLRMMLEIAQSIIYDEKPAFKIHVDRGLSTVLEASDLGILIRSIHICPVLYSPDIELPPMVQLCLHVYRTHALRLVAAFVPSGRSPDGRLIAEVCDDYIADVRDMAIATGIKRQQARWVRNAAENEKSVDTYLNRLRARSGDLAIFGIDLMCQQVRVSEENAHALSGQFERLASANQIAYFNGTSEHAPVGGHVGIEQVLSDRERLFSKIKSKSSIVTHLVGYVCSVSWSRVGGFNLYLACVFDGRHVGQTECRALSEAVGHYWVESVTSGRGEYLLHGLLSDDGYAAEWIGGNEDGKFDRWKRSLQRRALRDKFARPRLPDDINPKLFTMGRMPRPPE